MTYPDAAELIHTRLPDAEVWEVDTQNSWPFVLDRNIMQVDTRATSKKACRDLAWERRDSLLAWQFEADTPVIAVNLVSGPRWLPDPDGTPRYVTQVQVALRQNQQ